MDYGTVDIHFLVKAVHKNGNESSDDMLLCFKWCTENGMKPKWVKEEDCVDLNPVKTDVFVFEEFQGDAFAHLKKFKSVILGPRALLSCISDGKPIPKDGSTIFTTAMRDCLVCCTSINEHEKANLREKVTYMGGAFDAKRLLTYSTHLVAGDVRSNKYKQAVDANISIMSTQWVDAVWDASLSRNVHAKDKEFDRYKCPAFLGMNITSSNIPRKAKEKIKTMIEENGGVFQGTLAGGITNLLVIKGTQGDKYNFARKCGLPCVEEEWVYESAKLGHALDTKLYEVGRGCSTPKNDQPNFLADISTVSAIGYPNETLVKNAGINETVCSVDTNNASKMSSVLTPAAPVKPSVKLLDSLNKLDLKAVKAAGHFLDGCKVFLSGFEADSGEKLRRVLNAGGATRFNEISDSVSHVIVGNTSLEDIEQMLQSCVHRPLVVTLAWVLESIKIQGRALENKFLVVASAAKQANPEPPSPSLKKSLAMLRTPVVPPLVLDCPPPTDDAESAAGKLIPQYLGNGGAGPSTDATLFKVPPRRGEEQVPPAPTQEEGEGEEESQAEDFFEGLKFLLVGYDDEDTLLWTDTIEGFGGTVVAEAYRGVPDYGVVPFCGAVFRHATKEVVTDLWLESCSQANAKVPVEYYHLPVAAPAVKPLTGFVLGFSSYLLKERDYLILLSQVLGAVSQDVFARKDNPGKKVLASTHLVCAQPGSTKFGAAVKWGIPTVSHKWLLACLRERKVADISQYTVTQATTLSPTVMQPVPSLVPEVDADATKNGTMDRSADATKNRTMDHSADATYMPNATTTPVSSTKPNNTLVHSANSNTTPVSSTKSNNTSVQSAKSKTTPASSIKLDITPLNTSNISNTSTTASNGKDVTPHTSTGAVPQNYGFSQETPIRFPRLAGQETPRVSGAGYVGTPEMSTPESPFFNCIGNFSPNTRKGIKRWIDNGPDLQRKASPEHQSKKRKSTPVSVLMKRNWDKWSNILGENAEPALATNDNVQPQLDMTQSIAESNESNRNVAREGAGAYTQLNQLDQLLKASTSSEGVSADDATKLQRRSSLMVAAAITAATTTRAAPDHTAVEAGVKESQWSQSNDVGWEFQDRRVSSTEEIPKSLDTSSSKPTADNGKPKSSHDGPFKVILSTMSAQDREKYKQIVVNLGGIVLESTNFDLSATHLICMKPARSEKMLACIASGKWVLHSSYLDESSESGYFLQEENYEYGNPSSAGNIPTLTSGSMDERLALACYRWRTRLAANRTEKGAYHGITAIICTNPEKVDSFKRLVVAGGGRVVRPRPPFSTKSSATHLFIDDIKSRLVINYQALVNNGVLCLPLLFLNNFLVDFPAPLVEDHILPEAARLKAEGSQRYGRRYF